MKHNPTPDFDNLVFENRNKSYGAFFLRQLYKNNIVVAFLSGVTIFSLCLAAPVVYNTFFKEEETIGSKHSGQYVAEEWHEVELPEVEVPKEEIPEEKVATEKYTEPNIEDDKKIKKDEMPSEDDLKKSNAGTEHQDGKKDPDPIKPSGEEPKKEEPKKEPEVVTWADEKAEFPGGPSEYQKFLRDNIEYPEKARNEGLGGKVIVSFIVNTDGKITDVKIVKGIEYTLDQEALRVFRRMPKWKPAKLKGQIVPLKMTMPVTFQVLEE